MDTYYFDNLFYEQGPDVLLEKWEREKRCGESQKNDEEMLAFAAPFGEGENVFVEDMLAEESAENMWDRPENKAADYEFLTMLEEIEIECSRPPTPLQPPREGKKKTYLGNKSGNEEGNEPVRKVNAKRKVAATNGGAQRKQKSRKKKKEKKVSICRTTKWYVRILSRRRCPTQLNNTTCRTLTTPLA